MDLKKDLDVDRHRSFLNDLKNDLNIFIFYQMFWKMIFGSDQGSLNKSEDDCLTKVGFSRKNRKNIFSIP